MQSDKPTKSKSISLRLGHDDYQKLVDRAKADQRTVSNYLLKLILNDLTSAERFRAAIQPPAKKVAEDAVEYQAKPILHDPAEDDRLGH
jgi:uncharacterized protein (DUF1778 family)